MPKKTSNKTPVKQNNKRVKRQHNKANNKSNKKSKLKKLFWRLSLFIFFAFIFFVIYLDAKVKNEFDQQAWQIPAKVYARPLAFAHGKKLSISDLKSELNLLGYRQKIKATNQGEYELYQDAPNQASFVINTRRFQFWDGMQAAQVLEVSIKNNEIIQLLDFASQKAVNFLRLDPLSLGTIQSVNQSNEDRVLVNLEQLPEYFISALLNTEDRNFYQHWGISLKGIARAVWSNLNQGQLKQGGSTLTQQLMKNHFLTNERTLWRKFQEAIMATLTEYHYDKTVILQAYINEVYLGQNDNTGIYGFARASEFYFDKPLAKLNLSQVALLVGMVKGPSVYNPRRNPENAKERRDLVLKTMFTSGLITEQAFDDARSKTLQVIAKAKAKNSKVPAFIGYIKRELQQAYSLSELHKDGLRLFTSLDPLVQRKAEKALNQRLKKIEAGRSLENKNLQGAVVVSDIASGDILAMVGDRNPDYVGFNRAIDAYRQTGSVIKPFVYLSALKEPQNFNLLTPLLDQSFTLEGNDGSVWQPQNYDKQEHGEVSLSDALIHSYNLATARLALEVGVDKVVDTLYQMGFERKLPAFPSLALGAKEMSPLEVLKLYQVVANQGIAISSTGLIAVQDHQANLLQRYQRNSENVVDAESAFLIKYLLTQVTEMGTAKAIKQRFKNKTYAGKTGTTNDLRDSWYAGFGENTLAVVWLGRDDNQPSQLTGSSGALNVWADLYQQLDEPSVNLALPEMMVWGYEDGGFFSSFSNCRNKKLIPFYIEQLPKNYEVCD
jgi:penicillin-binding protein 1B